MALAIIETTSVADHAAAAIRQRRDGRNPADPSGFGAISEGPGFANELGGVFRCGRRRSCRYRNRSRVLFAMCTFAAVGVIHGAVFVAHHLDK
jgi:hypothetical protein